MSYRDRDRDYDRRDRDRDREKDRDPRDIRGSSHRDDDRERFRERDRDRDRDRDYRASAPLSSSSSSSAASSSNPPPNDRDNWKERRERDWSQRGGPPPSALSDRNRDREVENGSHSKPMVLDGPSSSSSSSASREKRDREAAPSSIPDDSSKKMKVESEHNSASAAASAASAAAAAAPAEKKQPISLEELMKKRLEEKAEAAKPQFLSKEQRAELALRRRQEEVEAQRRKVEEERSFRMSVASSSGSSNNDLDKEKERRDRERRDREYLDRREKDSREQKEKEEREQRAQEAEMKEQLKKQYLGAPQERKKTVKASEKFKPVFDWKPEEDTARGADYLKEDRALLFGRGHRGGIDSQLERKMAENYENLVAQKRQMLLQQVAQSSSSNSNGKKEAKGAEDGAIEDGEEDEEEQEIELIGAQPLIRPKVSMSLEEKLSKHWTTKKREEMTDRDWRILKEDYKIVTKGGAIPHPMRSWDEAQLPAGVMEAIKANNYLKPSGIQMQTIPCGILNRDVIGLAETGSGKTAAFVIPLLCYISRLPRVTEVTAQDGPYALILAPTHELAQQIETEARKFCTPMGYRILSVVGGTSMETQAILLRDGVEILVATPGRLIDLLDHKYLVLSQCNYLVLDEADRMIDMGFESQLLSILDKMPSSNLKPENEDAVLDANKIYRLTMMFSATMPPEMERIAKTYLRRPITIEIGEVGKAAERVEQRFEFCKSETEKWSKLCQMLRGEAPPIIVFVDTKKGVDVLYKKLYRDGFNCTLLHGDRNQDQREAALDGFRKGTFDILVATDVAGRGIDIRGVKHVINYEMAKTMSAYTHRIGRTGRAGATGKATTLLAKEDSAIFPELKEFVKKNSGVKLPAEVEGAGERASSRDFAPIIK